MKQSKNGNRHRTARALGISLLFLAISFWATSSSAQLQKGSTEMNEEAKAFAEKVEATIRAGDEEAFNALLSRQPTEEEKLLSNALFEHLHKTLGEGAKLSRVKPAMKIRAKKFQAICPSPYTADFKKEGARGSTRINIGKVRDEWKILIK